MDFLFKFCTQRNEFTLVKSKENFIHNRKQSFMNFNEKKLSITLRFGVLINKRKQTHINLNGI